MSIVFVLDIIILAASVGLVVHTSRKPRDKANQMTPFQAAMSGILLMAGLLQLGFRVHLIQ